MMSDLPPGSKGVGALSGSPGKEVQVLVVKSWATAL